MALFLGTYSKATFIEDFYFSNREINNVKPISQQPNS